MNVESFLKENMTRPQFNSLMVEVYPKDRQVDPSDGLLTVLSNLFDWGQSFGGYRYWYEVAHSEYV